MEAGRASCRRLVVPDWPGAGSLQVQKMGSAAAGMAIGRPGTTLAAVEPPEIARVLRAHSNAQATIFPFVVTGWVYGLAAGPAGPAKA